MGMYNSELEKTTKESISREKKRKTLRKAKKIAKMEDPKQIKKEVAGLKGSQKRKIHRLRKKIRRKEAKKTNERLGRERRNVEPENKLDDYNKGDTENRKQKDTNKIRQEDIKNPDKVTDKTFIDRIGRTMIKMRIITMKVKNKVSKTFKLAMSLLGFGWLGTILVGLLIALMASLITFGAITAIILSHPAAIQEVDKAGLLGNALELGNVAKDVKNDSGKVIVKGKGGTTGGNFKWYGKDADFGKGGTTNKPSTPAPSTPTTGELVGNDNAEKVWNYLKHLGFSEGAAAGVMGNLMQESGLNPKTVQNNGRGPGTGLVQWENGYSGRWNNLEKWAKKEGNRDVWAIDTQLDFMYYEMTSDNWQANMFGTMYQKHYGINAGKGVASVEFFKKESDPERAMYVFEYAFERAGSPAFKNRLKFTSEIYAKFKGK